MLDLEFKLEKNTNSGVFLRTGDVVEWLHTAIEVQVLDSYGKKEAEREDCGAIFDCLAPSMNAVNPPGEWNHYTITCKGSMITVVLNGHQVIAMDLNRWTEAHKNPDGTPNKFNTAYKDMPRVGHRASIPWPSCLVPKREDPLVVMRADATATGDLDFRLRLWPS